jgi:drug/metabolite transporter (DMT)-like permease
LLGATREAASIIGVVAGVIGLIHGYNETLQGNSAPSGIIINAIGPPCEGSSCLPAMTVIPNFFVTGVLAIILALVVLAWAAVLVRRKNGGAVLILLSVLLLLVGGGFLPPLLGIVAGAIGTRIKRT